MGAGINSGLGYLGGGGGGEKWGLTERQSVRRAPGDSVSFARICKVSVKNMDAFPLVGENTYKATQDEFYLKIDDLAVKGKSVGITIYTVLDDVKKDYPTSKKVT